MMARSHVVTTAGLEIHIPIRRALGNMVAPSLRRDLPRPAVAACCKHAKRGI